MSEALFNLAGMVAVMAAVFGGLCFAVFCAQVDQEADQIRDGAPPGLFRGAASWWERVRPW